MFKRPDFSPTTLFRENKNDLTCIFAKNTWFSLPACSRFVPKFTLHLTLKVKVSWHWNDASFQKWTQPSNWGRPRAFGPFSRKGTVYYDRAFRESAPLLQGLRFIQWTHPRGRRGHKTQKTTENEHSSYITLQDYADVLHTEPPKYHLGPNATSFGVYFVTLWQSCSPISPSRGICKGINIAAA